MFFFLKLMAINVCQPGSANVIGGEVIHVKTKGGTVANMIVRGAPRGLKMACGENPKRVYGSRGLLPYSRMVCCSMMF